MKSTSSCCKRRTTIRWSANLNPARCVYATKSNGSAVSRRNRPATLILKRRVDEIFANLWHDGELARLTVRISGTVLPSQHYWPRRAQERYGGGLSERLEDPWDVAGASMTLRVCAVN